MSAQSAWWLIYRVGREGEKNNKTAQVKCLNGQQIVQTGTCLLSQHFQKPLALTLLSPSPFSLYLSLSPPPPLSTYCWDINFPNGLDMEIYVWLRMIYRGPGVEGQHYYGSLNRLHTGHKRHDHDILVPGQNGHQKSNASASLASVSMMRLAVEANS